MPFRFLRTLPVDAVALVRAYHPMVVCFGGALAGTALVFDVFYLTAGAGLALAALYTVPLLAGLIACLIAAADDLGLERPVLSWTVAAAGAVGLTNVAVVATIAAMRRTGPSDWRYGVEAILLSAICVVCLAVTVAVLGSLANSLGIEIKTRMPERKQRPQRRPVPDTMRVPDPRPVARARGKPVRVEAPRRTEQAPDLLEPPAPRVVYLSEPRPVVPSADGTGHADRSRRGLAVPPPRRAHRPGRPPGRG